jgi:hypothetical protein
MMGAAAGVLVDEIAAGRLPVRQLWVAVRGGARYRKIVARGFVRTPEEADAAAIKCASCPDATRGEVSLTVNGQPTTAQVIWCGPKLTPNLYANRPTCGCLVAQITADGLQPAGKTVADERAYRGSLTESDRLEDYRNHGLAGCPQGLW